MKHRSRKQQPYGGTQAVRRAISLLKLFRQEKPVWSLAEICRTAGLNKTTVFRLLSALESEGLVARDPKYDTYALGPEIIVLGGQALRSNTLRSVSHNELKALAEGTGETSSLEILTAREVFVLDEIVGGHLMAGAQSIGTRWPAFATSTGKAILAYRPAEEVDVILRAPLPKITMKTITDPDILRRELGQVRKRGYAIADEALELGFIAIGAPLWNHDGEAVGAISVGGPTIRLTSRKIPEIGQQVRRSAERISAKLGYRHSVR
ncbi:MAG TPA: IclR family transcriptional regulator [Acidobacteriota bacterium]